MTARRRLVQVPASSANLGPGYDVLAAALALHLELEVEEAGAFSVEADGLGRSAGPHQPLRAGVRVAASGGRDRLPDPQRDPARGWLGSSAAAIVAGLLAADHLFELARSPRTCSPGRRDRGPPGQRRRGAARRLRRLRDQDGRIACDPARSRPGGRGRGRDPARAGADRGGAPGDPGRGAARGRRRQHLGRLRARARHRALRSRL